MAVIISLGNPGSGKTLTIVREMIEGLNGYDTYTNIVPQKPRKMPFVKVMNKKMIISESPMLKDNDTPYIKNGKPVTTKELNSKFWTSIKEPINVVIDEAHIIFNSRSAMSKENKIFGEWIALIRRVLGSRQGGSGDLILISQLSRRIDVIAREMASQIRYHVCHYLKTCNKCKYTWQESSETPEPVWTCPKCLSYSIKKHTHVVEMWKFKSMEKYSAWKEMGMKTYYSRQRIRNVEKYFDYYDTLQWENLFS